MKLNNALRRCYSDFEEVTTDLTDEQDIIHAYTHPFNLENQAKYA